MNYIRTFETYLYENGFKVGDKLNHSVYNNIVGTVEYGPSTFMDIKEEGYPIDDVDADLKKDSKIKVWYGVVLPDGTKIGIHQKEFKKAK